MKNVAVALYAEGSTDQLFLPEVIRRTAKQNLNQSGQPYIDVQPVDFYAYSILRSFQVSSKSVL